MSADPPPTPARHEALEEAGAAIRAARDTGWDEIIGAQRVLTQAARTHDHLVREAERAVASAHTHEETERAEKLLAEARADRHGVEEAQPLLRKLAGLVEVDEQVLDMAPGVSAGHDGVAVATSRQLLFVAPRRAFRIPYSEVQGVRVAGRWFGARLSVSIPAGKAVIAGLAKGRAADLCELLREGAARRPARA